MPAADHPWYGPRGKYPFPKKPRGRTLSDELRDAEIEKQARIEEVRNWDADEALKGSRDPSYSILSEGSLRRRPVRYD